MKKATIRKTGTQILDTASAEVKADFCLEALKVIGAVSITELKQQEEMQQEPEQQESETENPVVKRREEIAMVVRNAIMFSEPLATFGEIDHNAERAAHEIMKIMQPEKLLENAEGKQFE